MKKTKFSVIIVALLLMVSSAALANGTPIPEDSSCQNAGYKKGFFIQSCDGNYFLKTNIQLQPQYQTLLLENQNDVHTFQIRRGRLIFSGHAFDPNLTFKFQYEAIGGRANTTREGNLRGNSLRDAYVNYKFNDHANLRFGQFQPYYNREELTSSTKLQFVDRSILNDVFSLGRDLGIAFHGKAVDKKLEYSLYVTNEGGNINTTNFNTEMLFGGRLVWNILGNHGYTMSDVKDSEDHHLALGVAANFNRPSAAGDNTIIATSADIAYRFNGLSLLAEGHMGRNQTASNNVFGFLGQIGYFIVPERFEAALRGAAVIPTAAGLTNGYEFGGALNYFFKGHNLKLQADYAMLLNSPLVFQGAAGAASFVSNGGNPGFIQDQVDHRFRTQLQFYF